MQLNRASQGGRARPRGRGPWEIPGHGTARLAGAAAILLAALLPCRPASAVIVGANLGAQFEAAPAGTPGFNHVGYLIQAGSGVYLGDRWVLTAKHVWGGNEAFDFMLPVTGSSPVRYNAVPGSGQQIGGTDLAVFRLQQDPGLPTLKFGPSPAVGTYVTTVGTGVDRAAALQYWKLTGSADPTKATWTNVTGTAQQNQATRRGYYYGDATFTRRWGDNYTIAWSNGAATNTVSDYGSTLMFVTRFDTPTSLGGTGLDTEGQIADYDSGGAVFVNNRLVGINERIGGEFKASTDPDPAHGQPRNSVVFNTNYSYFADLYSYVDLIAATTHLAPGTPGDANLDGYVDAADMRIVYQNLDTGTKWTQGDFNLDGTVSFADYQLLELNYGHIDPDPLPAGMPLSAVPEPGTLMGLGGLAALALLRRRRGPR